ncbi:MAG: HNH endonuclease signature motif containing protein [Candidatus Parcubacteria bacterium]|nr:HNH endonuclease signature motif containing protein [Candidatus Parcubacteria bacterium]
MAEYNRKSNTICLICKKKIYRRPFEIENRGENVFCSAKCFGFHSRKEIPCLMCGKMLVAGLNKKTCSRTCANKNRAGIKYKIGRPNDKAQIFRALKVKLLKMRGKKCERCDYHKYEILQVHHKDKNRNHNELYNLELICPNCHYEEHFLEKSWLRNNVEKQTK